MQVLYEALTGEVRMNDGNRQFITDQIDLIEIELYMLALAVREKQSRALFKPCRLGELEGCTACKVKRWVLRKRYT